MATATATPQTNGVLGPSSSAGSGSQTVGGTQSQPANATPSQGAGSQPPTQHATQSQTQQPSQQQHPQHPTSTSAAAPRPRDARTLELLLTAQGVTAFESRVPLLLLDFAYRHTSSVLSDALHLAADPYTSQAGARPSATSGAAPVNAGDAAVSANAVQLAIASRLGYQFRGGGGAGSAAGGVSKDWMMELARERNRVALPRVAPSEWGVRLPNERFVLSGVSWGLKEAWEGAGDGEDSEGYDEDESGEAMEGVETAAADAEDEGGDGIEGGTMADVFGDEVEVGDMEMAEE